MPIEVVELVVKATINEFGAEQQGQAPSAAPMDGQGQEQISERERIVQEAVDIVLEILRQERER